MTILTEKNYVDKAEKVINALDTDNYGKLVLTTSQIRNLLSLTSALFDKAKTMSYESLISDISYLRVQFVYQAGRNEVKSGRNYYYPVKDLVEKAEILNCLEEIENKNDLILFCRYMEALVAYFKFYGGKD